MRLELQLFGGRGSSSSGKQLSYPRLPMGTLFKGVATKEEQSQKRATVKKFISEAKAGNIYESGSGIGSAGSKFEIVNFNRSPNKLGIKSLGSSRAVALTSQNVVGYIKNGAKMIGKKK